MSSERKKKTRDMSTIAVNIRDVQTTPVSPANLYPALEPPTA